ncbi:MAG: hypothetical protein QW165_05540 [Candidatus Woesearchaeota archaeon]
MAEEHKGIALVILGIVAVLAIVGLVLLFTQRNVATGKGIYGGAIKGVEYPNWVGRGVPRNIPGEIPGSAWMPGTTISKDLTTHWNWEGNPKRAPPGGGIGDIPSPVIKCGQGCFLVSIDPEEAGYYASLGYPIINTLNSKAGLCVCPNRPMVGGIAGQSGFGYGYGS